MSKLANYKKLNNSFKKGYIFHLGAEAGFYSEFNNMVYAILYCLKYRYKFILYSSDANFALDKGWEDFFEPFCESANTILLKNINTRTVAPKLNRKQKIQYKLFKLLYPNTLLTYQLWPRFFCPAFEKEIFDFPELGINGSLRQAARSIVDIIYKHNNVTSTKIQLIKNRLNLPNDYLAVNIRRGDKNTEVKYVETKTFVNELERISTIKAIFVFTDDYRVIEEIKDIDTFGKYHLYFLVKEDEKGYIHSDFSKLKKTEKAQKLINMFASIEIMIEAKIAIGQFTTNPGFFLGMKMSEDSFLSLQKKSWYLFDVADILDDLNPSLKDYIVTLNDSK